MIEVTAYKVIAKNSLQGVFSIKIAKWGDLTIREMAHFKKSDAEWVAFPNRQYVDKDTQEKKYFEYFRFINPETTKLFQEKVKDAINKYFEQHPELRMIEPKQMELFEGADSESGPLPF
jgi:hypothetical protein